MRGGLLRGGLRTVLAAWTLIGTSTWAFVVAIAVYAFNEDGAGAVSAVIVARLIPAMFAAPVVGHLLDRYQRDTLAALFSFITAASMGGTAALVLSDASLGLVIAATAVVGATASASRPALQTVMPALAQTPEQLTRATAAWAGLDSAGFLLGSGLGGLAIAAFDPGPVIAAAAVFSAIAGLLAITLPPTVATLVDDEPDEEESAWRSALGGLRALRDIKGLRTPFALLTGLILIEGSSDVQLVALAIEDLDMGDGGPGLLYAIWGVGGLVGSAAVLALLRRRGYGLAMALGTVALGAAIALAGLDGVALALAVMIPAGFGFALVEASAMGLVPRLADDTVAGRVYGLYELVYAGAGAGGAIVAGILISLLGTEGSMAVTGAAYAVAGVLAWRALSRLDEGQEEAGRVRELLRGVSFLRPLPLPRLERLVRNARPESVASGTTIMKKGDEGEDFYVIEEGTVEIVEYGREQHAGEGFGEIALLKQVPRTATVKASTDVRLRVLARPAFIGAITDDGDASSIADSVVDEHLARPLVEDD